MVSKYIVMAKDNSGHLYLLQKREFIITNTTIYKVGRSQSIQKRLCSYANCLIIQVWFVNDVYKAETQVIQIMKGIFEQRKDIGNEYFEGDPFKMKKSIFGTKEEWEAHNAYNFENEVIHNTQLPVKALDVVKKKRLLI
jgi:hypothetical protein